VTADWDPARYERFAAERAQPFWDLLDLVEPPVRRLVDLGCGTGALTAAAARRLDATDALGIDRSPAMLAVAAQHANASLRFEQGDVATWAAPGGHDLVLANASLQWSPDHASVLRRWTVALDPGGRLAVQVPANADHPSHLAITAVAEREPYRSAFGADGPPPDPVAANVLPPERYAEILHALGYVDQHVRLQVYPHVLASSHDVVEWTRGTSLTRIVAELPGDLHDRFIDDYRAELIERIGERAPYLYAFKRILFSARRP
jgi:trans-aconitate 2-methyltransferase